MNVDTGELRNLTGDDRLLPNEVAVAGDEELLARLSRNVRRGVAKTDPSLPMERRIAMAEDAQAERDQQTAKRGSE